MSEAVYGALQQFGYDHPLHPVAVHLPVGLVIAVFLFSVAAMLLRSSALAQTARHCAFLALVSAPVAAAGGLLDWQHFYGGVWTAPFIIKGVLAALLLISLAVAVFKGMKKDVPVKRLVPIYFFSLAMVVGLGFIGGELVYGDRFSETGRDLETAKAPKIPAQSEGVPDTVPAARADRPEKIQDPAAVEAGRGLFRQKCAFCHHTDSGQTKIGPGLQGLFARDRLPVSRWPATEESVRRQIKTPYDRMPPFPDLPDEDVEAILSFLKTL